MSPFLLAGILRFLLDPGAAEPPPQEDPQSASKPQQDAEPLEQPRSPFRHSLAIIDEGVLTSGLRIPGPDKGNRFVVQPGFTYKTSRWNAVAKFATVTDSSPVETHTRLRVREAYGSVSLGDFDLMAGKRMLRWGVGYAFTATGALDPPRRVGDPADRLNLNEGREMVKLDWTRNGQSVTVAWATAGLPFQRRFANSHDTSALRYNALMAGFDTSFIVAHDGGGSTVLGGNFTRVFGESLELHGEYGHRDGSAVLLGAKYIRSPGITVLGEFFTAPNTDYFRSSLLAPSAGRQKYGFLRVGKTRLSEAPFWRDFDLSASLMTNLNDRSRVLVSDVSKRFGLRVSAYCYGQFPFGAPFRSEYGRIPYSALLSVGIRYQQ